MPAFIHLHTHSCYSFLSGLASPQELARTAASFGMPGLALTDLGNLSGAVEFYDACHAEGIQPIIGLDLQVTSPGGENGSLLLLALSLPAWSGLCRLASTTREAQTAVSYERLAAEAAGLLCLTGGRRSLLEQMVKGWQRDGAARWLGMLREVFNGRLYVELNHYTPQDEPLQAELVSLARAQHLPLAAANEVYYLQPEQAGLQRTATAVRLICPVSEVMDEACAPPGAYFLSPEQAAGRFAAYSQALDGTAEVASRCRLELPLGLPQFPTAPTTGGRTPQEELQHRAVAGALHQYGQITPEIQTRLERELQVIEKMGFASLFLIMEDILGFARRQGIPTASRGSASSSLVAHCLGITSPDPLGLNLYFERFLNPARTTPPDIDTDLCSRRRDEIIHYVYERFGPDRVAMVCTINRFRRRSALRETAKAYGLSPQQVSALTDDLPHRWYGPPERLTSEGSPFGELVERYPAPVYQAIFRDAAALIGLPHHLSIHPGGMVISPGALTDLAPTQVAPKGVVITQFDLDSIERLGLVKIDLLGIRGLTVLGDVACALDPQRPLDALEAIPENDPATSELVKNGRTIGCFQIESPGMRATLKEIQACCIEDLIVALALYRPGPLTGGLKDAFVRRHLGREAPAQLHPALTPLLSDTYGVILYQEQVLRIAHDLAGLSLADADLLRRAMSHFDPGKQMQTLKEKFIAGAAQHSGVPENTAERIWELMAAFAGYGFPKAHAASYAVVAWRSAWCKTHYPALFMGAVLANWGGFYSQRVYLTEARRMGLALRPPHINHARHEFSLQYIDGLPVLFMGLGQVKDLTRRTIERIIRQRPFYSLDDFLARTDPRPVEAENLVQVGALEGLGLIPTLLQRVRGEKWQGGQFSFFSMLDRPVTTDWGLVEQTAAQEVLLGVGVAAHPLELAAGQVLASGALSTVEAVARIGQRVRVAGMRQTWRRFPGERGEPFYFMALEDLDGMLEVVIPGDVYRRCRAALSGPGPYLIDGVVEVNKGEGEPFVRASGVEHL